MEGFIISVLHIESSASAIGGGGVSTPPVILEHPQSLYAPFNSKVSLSISAEGEELQYQWYRNNKLLPGQTTPTLTIPTITETSRGLYHCVVSGCHENSMSRPAHLTVTPGKLNFPPQSRVGKFRLPFSQSESAIPLILLIRILSFSSLVEKVLIRFFMRPMILWDPLVSSCRGMDTESLNSLKI
ncbi:PREDICTED: uncharacterized protein LOC109590153 [Amphimedon queenslandica]|uniref:Ig-like domain-containing protein n=1 Tax=Amphimedon queenslandica TaxID=400682 RepID=A0AAN0JXJ6_AMPQE|nr:PREDICTED: uncharacterized protein LOC109590153 [Amphimedon queenslandica]|eukprot:XP_019861638.1 PREDICTED: uncharacterized protein LOC109590153 [Amphimedon queenslandica]